MSAQQLGPSGDAVNDNDSLASPPDSLLAGNGYSTPATSNIPSPVTPEPSYKSIYATPPPVVHPYRPEDALDDLPGVSYALEMFLASHMVESEDYCHKSDEKKCATWVPVHWRQPY